MSGFLGAGDVYIDRFDSSDQPTGFRMIGNATVFQITEAADIKERKSLGRDTYGQTLDTVSIKQPAKINITVNELAMENLALALMGDVAALSQTSGSVDAGTPEDVVAEMDKWVELDYAAVSAVVVKDDEDTRTYVEDTDYEVNARLGMIQALSGGDIADGETLHVSYSYGAITGELVSGGTKTQIKCKIKLDGINFTDNKNVVLDVKEAVIKPSSAVDFLSEDFTEVVFEGSLNTPTGETTPYTIQYY